MVPLNSSDKTWTGFLMVEIDHVHFDYKTGDDCTDKSTCSVHSPSYNKGTCTLNVTVCLADNAGKSNDGSTCTSSGPRFTVPVNQKLTISVKSRRRHWTGFISFKGGLPTKVDFCCFIFFFFAVSCTHPHAKALAS